MPGKSEGLCVDRSNGISPVRMGPLIRAGRRLSWGFKGVPMKMKNSIIAVMLAAAAAVPLAADEEMKIFKSKFRFRISYPKSWHLDASSFKGYRSIRDIRPGSDPCIQIYNINPAALAGDPENDGPISAENIKIEIYFYFKNPESMDDWLKGRPADAQREFIVINKIKASSVLINNEEYPGHKIINLYYTTGARAIQVYCYPADTKHLKTFYRIMESFRFE